MQHVTVKTAARPVSYKVIIGAGALSRLGEVAQGTLTADARRVALISNRKVFELYGKQSIESLSNAGFRVAHWLMNDGERFKNLTTLKRALDFLVGTRLERSDAVVALGGGVVGDLAGFAAAVYLRGIAFVQVPTTLLAQVDASVGGKVAVNTDAGKNLIGAFHHPRAVLIDTDTLRTLPRRELTAGWCESVKQGAVGDRSLFDMTYNFLRKKTEDKNHADQKSLEGLIAAQVAFKASIVALDEREDVSRTDRRSRRILNFGHTTAHALEAITNYRRFRHGEAVGYGMLVAGEISKRLGLLARSELELLSDAVGRCGRLPPADDLNEDMILGAISLDKKSVGGHLKWILLERIGRARVVDGREVDKKLLRASLRAAFERASKNK
ncbi:MAG TPA: 3-dehydroquinate synthase [Pyrinomonadaceae bacterium]|nr:3-dehydroquinate synthase [Pyrinomonadaceae bacterium]